MSNRKPLPEACTGDDLCPVDGHTFRPGRGHRRQTRHITLTPGQRKTLAERQATTKQESDR